ncbi:MAG: hypothetical protein GKS03_09775 [Alphaproteobacteria bacterium]|nr:hypothetical protein [Alphaproteobacteria bacterium]
MAVTSIHGPIISCGDLAAQQSLFEAVYGLRTVAEENLTGDSVAALWGLSEHTAQTVVLETPGTGFGIRLIQFDPPSDIVIRHKSSGYNSDALKVIDFYAPDFYAAKDHLESKGYHLKDEVAEYELENGKFLEGHLWGPDSVVTAIVSGPKDFFRNFATTTEKLFSEVHSISAPISDLDAVLSFYDTVLGLGIIHEYGIDHESFADLVGTQHKMKLRAKNVGIVRTEPYFGLIHYGLPETAYESLRDRAVMPNRGLVGATVLVDNAAEVSRNAESHGAEVLSTLAEVSLAPYGKALSFTVRGPHGVVHHVIEVS